MDKKLLAKNFNILLYGENKAEAINELLTYADSLPYEENKELALKIFLTTGSIQKKLVSENKKWIDLVRKINDEVFGPNVNPLFKDPISQIREEFLASLGVKMNIEKMNKAKTTKQEPAKQESEQDKALKCKYQMTNTMLGYTFGSNESVDDLIKEAKKFMMEWNLVKVLGIGKAKTIFKFNVDSPEIEEKIINTILELK